MKVVFLGTVGYYPTETRHTNCVVIKDLSIIIDAGSGFFRLPRFITSDEITILLSHYHMDHICGLTQLLGLFKGKRVKIMVRKESKILWIRSLINPIFLSQFLNIHLLSSLKK